MNTFSKYLVVVASLASLAMGASAPQNELTPAEKAQGWVLLFDGRTSNGWMKASGKPFPETGWKIADGALSIVPGGKGGDIVTADEYSDFELSVDFRMTPACNSGIKYLFAKYAKGGNLGMEYQVIDDKGGEDTKQANHLAASLYDVLPPNEGAKKMRAIGEWNTARIVCRGRHVEHWLNGAKVLEYERGSADYLAAVARSKFKSTEPAFGMVEKGRILLQEHGHEASFRNIKLRRL